MISLDGNYIVGVFFNSEDELFTEIRESNRWIVGEEWFDRIDIKEELDSIDGILSISRRI